MLADIEPLYDTPEKIEKLPAAARAHWETLDEETRAWLVPRRLSLGVWDAGFNPHAIVDMTKLHERHEQRGNLLHLVSDKRDPWTVYQEVGNLTDYGVCDGIENLLADPEYGSLLQGPRVFTVFLTEVRKEECGGWRWHKWGRYIGAQKPTHEYLRDEKNIESVWVFTIFEHALRKNWTFRPKDSKREKERENIIMTDTTTETSPETSLPAPEPKKKASLPQPSHEDRDTLVLSTDDLYLVEDPSSPRFDPRMQMPLDKALQTSLAEEAEKNPRHIGNLVPVLVAEAVMNGKHVYEVLDGRQRVRNAREVNKKRKDEEKIKIYCIVRQAKNDREAVETAVGVNAIRKETNGWHMHEQVMRMVGLGMKGVEIAKTLGVSQGQVSKLRSLSNLIDEAKDFLRKGEINLAFAIELASLSPEEQSKALSAAKKARGDAAALVRKKDKKKGKKGGSGGEGGESGEDGDEEDSGEDDPRITKKALLALRESIAEHEEALKKETVTLTLFEIAEGACDLAEGSGEILARIRNVVGVKKKGKK